MPPALQGTRSSRERTLNRTTAPELTGRLASALRPNDEPRTTNVERLFFYPTPAFANRPSMMSKLTASPSMPQRDLAVNAWP
jgi:hypothetical protein